MEIGAKNSLLISPSTFLPSSIIVHIYIYIYIQSIPIRYQISFPGGKEGRVSAPRLTNRRARFFANYNRESQESQRGPRESEKFHRFGTVNDEFYSKSVLSFPPSLPDRDYQSFLRQNPPRDSLHGEIGLIVRITRFNNRKYNEGQTSARDGIGHGPV